jgi:hypothetical protein
MRNSGFSLGLPLACLAVSLVLSHRVSSAREHLAWYSQDSTCRRSGRPANCRSQRSMLAEIIFTELWKHVVRAELEASWAHANQLLLSPCQFDDRRSDRKKDFHNRCIPCFQHESYDPPRRCAIESAARRSAGQTVVTTRCTKGGCKPDCRTAHAGSRLKPLTIREGTAWKASLPAVLGKTRRTE